MSSSFLDLLERHPSARREAEEGCGGPAAQGHRPEQVCYSSNRAGSGDAETVDALGAGRAKRGHDRRGTKRKLLKLYSVSGLLL